MWEYVGPLWGPGSPSIRKDIDFKDRAGTAPTRTEDVFHFGKLCSLKTPAPGARLAQSELPDPLNI